MLGNYKVRLRIARYQPEMLELQKRKYIEARYKPSDPELVGARG